MYDSKDLGNLSDRDLLAESRSYEKNVTDHGASLNFGAAEANAIKGFNDVWEPKLERWDEIQDEEAEVSVGKSDGRANVLGEMRRQRNILYADTTIDDATLAKAGLPPRDKIKTDSPAPSSAPIGWVDYGKLKHTIHFRDAATPDQKAKPDGMRGCEIWYFIGSAPPTAESDYRYLATDTNSPYVANYTMADRGKTVYYQLRWISNSGEIGEWSETIEATING